MPQLNVLERLCLYAKFIETTFPMNTNILKETFFNPNNGSRKCTKIITSCNSPYQFVINLLFALMGYKLQMQVGERIYFTPCKEIRLQLIYITIQTPIYVYRHALVLSFRTMVLCQNKQFSMLVRKEKVVVYIDRNYELIVLLLQLIFL